jgi:hypothetical protein
MNNKAQMQQVGLIFGAFIIAIVALGFFNPIASNIASTTDTQTATNETITLAAANTTTNLKGRELVGTLLAYNATGDPNGPITNPNSTGIIAGANFTITSNVLVTGDLFLRITAVDNSPFRNSNINVSYEYKPVTYIDNGGGRALASIILVFAALALAIAMIVPSFRNGIMDMFGK